MSSKFVRKIISVFLLGLLVLSCSESKETEKTEVKTKKIFIQQVNLNLEEIHCWLNLMPGGKATFNVSGKLKILFSTKYDYRTMVLSNISVFQNGSEIYLIKPTVENLTENDLGKEIAFSTIRGVGIVPQLNPEKKVSLKLIFKDGSDSFTYVIENVTIEKVH